MSALLDVEDDVLGGLPSRSAGLRSDAVKVVATVVVAAVLFGAASVLDASNANRATSLFLLAAIGVAWNLIGGFGGQFSLGHSIFVGVGGYTTAVLLDRTHLPLPVVVVLSGMLAAAVGVVLAYPLVRLRGPYFAIGTLGVALAVTGWMLNWDFTKRSQGYSIPVEDLVDLTTLYRYSAAIVLVSVIAVVGVMRSPLGLRLLALREDEAGALSIGVRRLATLLPAWALSAFLTGLVGAVAGLQKGALEPVSAFSLQFTLDAVIVCVIGGLGTLQGPLIGAVIVFVLRQYVADFQDTSTLIEALVLVIVVRVAPSGLMGLFQSVNRRVRALRPSSSSPVGRKS